MSKSLASVFGRAHRMAASVDAPFVEWPDAKQLIGIEIEFEMHPKGRAAASAIRPGDTRVVSVLPDHISLWQREADGSLINGQEWKLRSPLAGGRLAEAIYEFFGPQTKMYRSVTSGTHIHLNMDEDYTPLTAVQSLAALVYVIEPAMFSIIDPGRKWSGFTNPLDTAPQELIHTLFDERLEQDAFRLVSMCSSNRAFKYYGLNVQTLGSYGSMEFRYFPTATSADELVDWVSMVQSIKQAALAHPTSEAMLSAMESEDGYANLLTSYLSRWAERIMAFVPHTVARRRIKDLRAKSKVSPNVVSSIGTYRAPISANKKYSKYFKKGASTAAVSATEGITVAAAAAGRMPIIIGPDDPSPLVGTCREGDIILRRTPSGDIRANIIVADGGAVSLGTLNTQRVNSAFNLNLSLPSTAVLAANRHRDYYNSRLHTMVINADTQFNAWMYHALRILLVNVIAPTTRTNRPAVERLGF